MSTPDAILPTYEEKAAAYARRRAQGESLLERAWLDRLLDRPHRDALVRPAGPVTAVNTAQDSARNSARDSALNSALNSAQDSAQNSAQDSAQNSAQNSAPSSAQSSAQSSEQDSPQSSAQDSPQDSEPRPLAPIRVLDLGCGPGVPIAAYLLSRGCEVTGVDGAKRMIDLFRENLPQAEAHHADMRGLDLGVTFDAILAWDSFFHLSPADQRAMFPVFARHAAPGARLLFTSGPAEGTAIGAVEGAPVYHSSQSPKTYRAWLAEAGFAVLSFVPEDPACGMHSVWLAELR